MTDVAGTYEVLLVEDDPGDIALISEAFAAHHLPSRLHTAGDGVEALSLLRREDSYLDAPRPDLILLDLNMPRMDGRELLAVVKTDLDLCTIPVVVFSTSDRPTMSSPAIPGMPMPTSPSPSTWTSLTAPSTRSTSSTENWSADPVDHHHRVSPSGQTGSSPARLRGRQPLKPPVSLNSPVLSAHEAEAAPMAVAGLLGHLIRHTGGRVWSL
jgi:CheY-like chemotaxis protein